MAIAKHRKPIGQGLVEFALILPLLLAVLLGIFEFGRILLIYSNLFNAAREGVRYGITNPRDQGGIYDRAAEHTLLIAPDDPNFQLDVSYDTGPGLDSQSRTFETVAVGDRVLVRIQYPIRPMTPFFDPIVGEINLNTQAARTVQSVGLIISGPPPEGPSPPGEPDDPGDPGEPGEPPPTPQIAINPVCGPSGDQTITVSGTGWMDDRVDVYFNDNRRINNSSITAGAFTFTISVNVADGSHLVEVFGRQTNTAAQATYTVPCSAEPPPPEPQAAIVIDRPVVAGQIQVTGSAEPEEQITLLIDGVSTATVTVNTEGRFTFSGLLAPLQGGTAIVVQGYGEQDSVIVDEEEPLAPIIIAEPIMAGDTQVTGVAEPEQSVTLRVNGSQRGTATVSTTGTFTFSGIPPLQAGETVIVEGYGQQDLAIVEGVLARSPITITTPVYANSTVVSGQAEPLYAVTLRVIQTGLRRTVAVGADGTFQFADLPALVEGHTIVVEGYGEQDVANVQAPPATDAYIYIDETCLPPGSQTFVVHVNNPDYSTSSHKESRVYWNGQLAASPKTASTAYDVSITRNVTLPGPHSLRVDIVNNQNVVQVAIPAISIPVCDTTPPSTLPDLVITDLRATDVPVPGTYERVHLSVSIRNIGETHVTSLFWVDLFADFDLSTPLSEQPSVDYVAVNALAAGSTITFTMYVPDGFATTGEHTLAAMVDTWNQISEVSEDNNVSATVSITITEQNPPPEPAPVLEGPIGDIAGETFVDNQPIAGISIYLYALDGRLVASGRSGVDGLYTLYDIPVGDYTVVGEYREADAYAMTAVAITNTESLTWVPLYLTTIEGTSP